MRLWSPIQPSEDHLCQRYLADLNRIVVGVDEGLPALDQNEHR